MKKLFLIYTQLTVYFEINFVEPLSGKRFYNLCSSLNSLILEFYLLYNFAYERDGWIFFIKEKNNIIQKLDGCIFEYTFYSFEDLIKLMRKIRRRVWTQLSYEKSCQFQAKAYDEQCTLISRLIPQHRAFLHTSIKICNRMKKQRLKLSLVNRATVLAPILTMPELMTLILKEIGWLTTPQFIDYYWKITQLIKQSVNESGLILENELETLITLELNNLDTKP